MKLGFFARMYLAITDFRLYPYVVQKEKWTKALRYFLRFILFVSIVLSISGMIKIHHWLSEFMPEYQDRITEFEVNNGELTVDKNMDFDFLGVKIYTTDEKDFEEVDMRLLDLDKYQFSILAFKDSLAIGNSGFGYALFPYQQMKGTMNKQELYSKINRMMTHRIYQFIFTSLLLISLFIILSITRLSYIVLITLMLMLLGFVFKIKYRFRDYMKASAYIITLPTITEVIALICVGGINDYATITYYLLCYVYMFYAVRALKLNDILTATQEKIMSIKTETQEANSILEQEKQNKEKENNVDEKNDNENKKE